MTPLSRIFGCALGAWLVSVGPAVAAPKGTATATATATAATPARTAPAAAAAAAPATATAAAAEDPVPDFSKAEWEEIRDEEGIQVYRWEPPDGGLFAFKGVTVTEAPLPRLLSVLTDVARRKEWMPNLLEGYIVRPINMFERIEYMALKTPPLTDNRDFVFRAKADYDKAKHTVRLRFTSVTDAKSPESDDRVRGRVIDSTYTLTALSDTKTTMELRVLVDPEGNLPNWVVNFVTRNTPYNTLNNVRTQVLRSDVVVEDDVKALLGL